MTHESAAARALSDMPKGLIRLSDGRIMPRRHGWLEPGEHLRCPFGHYVHPASALHEGSIIVECKIRPETGEKNCGCLLYVATGTMGVYWTDMTEEENQNIKLLGIPPMSVAKYLNIDFPK